MNLFLLGMAASFLITLFAAFCVFLWLLKNWR